MRITERFSSSPVLTNLGLDRSKADVLLRIKDDDKLDEFVSQHNDERPKLSTRELETRMRAFNGVIPKKPKTTKLQEASSTESADLHGKVNFIEDCVNSLISHFIKNPDIPNVFDSALRLHQLYSEIMDRYSLKDGTFCLNDYIERE